MEQYLPPWVLVLTKISFLVCCLWHLLGGVLLWSKGDQWVCWFWVLLGGTSQQINVRHCLWLAHCTCEELQSNLQL